MKKKQGILFLLGVLFSILAFGTGEAGTYFNIYIPPSNVNQGKDVSLIVTAMYDSTFFRINDTGEDGDTDDSASGMLMTGQSYIMYLRNNGVNDDAAHAGETNAKQDGDHFLVTANKLILVSQAAKSDWEHDWLPSTNKFSKGSKFFVYANEVTTSPNDLNVMAYEDSTYVTVSKISKTTNVGQGYTNVSLINDTVVAQVMLQPGKDIIYQLPNGRDILKPGETYLIQTNKDVTVQYGALYTDEQDGGGYVPSSNGTGTGDLFYFAVPFEDSMQQEVRIVSWNDSNNVVLERYSNGQWLTVSQFNALGKYKPAEWVGKTLRQTFATIFRVRCTAGKNVTVFEGNWIETGHMITSDISSMAPSDNGTSAGENFVVYLPTPAEEGEITDPFTGNKLPEKGTHAYIFGNADSVAHVTVKDAGTNGAILNRTYTVPAGFYVDCGLDSAQWVAIYNGTGTLAGGPNRPYLLINADKAVSVEVTNFNDNWMMYFGSATPHGFDLSMSSNKPDAKGGDTVQYTTTINLNGNAISNGRFTHTADNGLRLLSSFIIDSTTHVKTMGTVSTNTLTGKTTVTYPMVQQFNSTHLYRIQNKAIMLCTYSNGTPIYKNTILTVETQLTAVNHNSSEMASANTGIVADSVSSFAAAFNLSSNTVTEGQSMICTATTLASTYNWNFGDNNHCTGRVTYHTYWYTGTFNVELTETNAAGCTATVSKTVSVVVRRCAHPDEAIEVDTTTTGKDDYNPTIVPEVTETKEPKIWSAGNKVYVDFSGINNVSAGVNIYTLLGQEIGSEKFTNDLIYTRTLNNIAAGYIVVAVQLNGKLYGKRIFISGEK